MPINGNGAFYVGAFDYIFCVCPSAGGTAGKKNSGLYRTGHTGYVSERCFNAVHYFGGASSTAFEAETAFFRL